MKAMRHENKIESLGKPAAKITAAGGKYPLSRTAPFMTPLRLRETFQSRIEGIHRALRRVLAHGLDYRQVGMVRLYPERAGEICETCRRVEREFEVRDGPAFANRIP